MCDYDYGYEDDLDSHEVGGYDFAQPGSALRCATADNPRNQPCPTCEWPNRLTPADVFMGYQCDSCANVMERGGEIDYYEEPEPMTPETIAAHVKLTFEVIYEPCGAKVTVEGAGSETIRVIVAFPNNQSMVFVHEVCSDEPTSKITFHREGYYAAIVVDLEGSLI